MNKIIAAVFALILSGNILACTEMNAFKYCKGALVINKSGLKAQIIELLPNNRAVVKYPQYEIEEYANLKDLAVSTGESLGHAINDEVMTPYGETGVISGVFQDGDISIFINDFWNHKVFSAEKIALIDGCTEDQFCVGQQVSNPYGKVATIVAYFPHEGQVFLEFPRQERFFKWDTKKLKHVE